MKRLGQILHASLICCMLVLLPAAAAHAEKRVALVIGNSAYTDVPELANPKNDASDMAAKLEAMGFEVVSGFDLDLVEMRKTVREFITRLGGADMALFFYAGHGMQVNGSNYIAPVDAKLASFDDLDFETLPLDLVLSAMERNTRVNLLFLDACRDNPLAENLARSMGTRSGAVGRGLAKLGSGVGSLIAFATQPGNVALDGMGRNSPFTKALLKHLGTPGQGVTEDLILVRRDVLGATGGKQVPWDNSSLTGKVVLVPKAGEPLPEPASEATKTGSTIELAYWNSIKDQNEKGYFEAYLAQYPRGTFAALARLRIAGIERGLGEKRAAKEPANPTAGAPPLSAGTILYPREVQQELNRVGCSVGKIDGLWGPASAKALNDYAIRQGIKLASTDPSADILDRLKAVTVRVCPLVCGRGMEEKNGRCETVKRKANVETSPKSDNLPSNNSKSTNNKTANNCPKDPYTASVEIPAFRNDAVQGALQLSGRHPCGGKITCSRRSAGSHKWSCSWN